MKNYDSTFTTKLDAWQPTAAAPITASKNLSSDTDTSTNTSTDMSNENSNDTSKIFDADNRKIILLTFENKFAPLGGLAAVMRLLPKFLQKYGEEVIIVTPLYTNIPTVKNAIASGALEPVFTTEKIELPQGKKSLVCYKDSESHIPYYYIGIDGLFTAALNPYSYDDSDDILNDSLGFCAAVPQVLAKLRVTENLLFHAHDWEAAPIAITSKRAVENKILKNARTVLTLHNSFDSGITREQKKFFFGLGDKNSGETILQCTIPHLNGPLTTVSSPFADELRNDPLQHTVFTSHLQKMFVKNPPIGIENGMFGKPYLPYTHSALTRARRGEFSKLLAQKKSFREEMLRVVRNMKHENVVGSLDIASGKDDNRAVFFMSGRLDLMQKGFDVIFRAAEICESGKFALIFCPSSAEGEKNSEKLQMFKEIANARKGEIVIWPFRITSEDYAAVVRGSSFLLMPSFYEPFGAATEGFMHGTPVIARASGGLITQVRDDDAGASSGILFHESANEKSGGVKNSVMGKEWRKILDAPIDERIEIPLYATMVKEASGALKRATEIFADGDTYGQMMLNGMDSLRNFSWDTAVWKYRRVYDVAVKRGICDI